jgi:hypothetical protein
MKKLVALFLCVIVAFPVFAKNDKDRNEFSITYGQYTVPQFAYVMGGVFGAMFTAGHFTFENPHLIGAAGGSPAIQLKSLTCATVLNRWLSSPSTTVL